jgi:serine/threonine protein kinase
MNMKNVNNICMGCFAELDSATTACPHCGYDEAKQTLDPHHLRPRTILNGKYLVGKILGEGGFGITYLGWDLNLDRKVAIKEYYPLGFVSRETTATANTTVHPLSGTQGEFFLKGRERFVGEAKTLAKFDELPGIVTIKDYFQENGTAYIVMTYVEGQTLRSYLDEMGGKLPPAHVFDLMKPVLTSLARIHESGLIHRDISPDNIMIGEFGVKLLDFGAAREFGDSGNKSLSIMLKPGYAPEEQYRSKGVQGPWTDVYALCATIYKCITGVTPEESMERIAEDTLKPPRQIGAEITAKQETAIMKGMAVKQEKRYKDMHELYASLYDVPQETLMSKSQLRTGDNPPPTTALAPAKQSRLATRKHLIALYAAVAVLTLVAGGLALWILPEGKSNQSEGETDTVASAFDNAPPTASAPAPSPPSVNSEKGDIVTFGGYEWRVLEVNNGKALLLSEKILEFRASQEHRAKISSITWAQSDIRTYLNGEFYDSLGTDSRAQIVETKVANGSNLLYRVSGGLDTSDKIFLLSLDEVVKHFGDSGEFANNNRNSGALIDDQYNEARIAYSLIETLQKKPAGSSFWWWLRSPGDKGYKAAFVTISGSVSMSGIGVSSNGGIRPALWITL